MKKPSPKSQTKEDAVNLQARLLKSATHLAAAGAEICVLGKNDDPDPATATWRTEPDAIERAIKKKEATGCILRTGPSIGVLAAEGEEGRESLDALFAHHGGVPQTATVRRGAAHELYFSSPDPIPSVDLAPGLRMIGEGGYAWCASSTDDSGETVKYAHEMGVRAVGIAELPGHLRRSIIERRRPAPDTHNPLPAQPEARSIVLRLPEMSEVRVAGGKIHLTFDLDLAPLLVDERQTALKSAQAATPEQRIDEFLACRTGPGEGVPAQAVFEAFREFDGKARTPKLDIKKFNSLLELTGYEEKKVGKGMMWQGLKLLD